MGNDKIGNVKNEVLDKGLVSKTITGKLGKTAGSDGKCGCRDECPCYSKCVGCPGDTGKKTDVINPDPTEYRTPAIKEKITKGPVK